MWLVQKLNLQFFIARGTTRLISNVQLGCVVSFDLSISDVTGVYEFGGLDFWNGPVEWTTGVEYWTAMSTNEL